MSVEPEPQGTPIPEELISAVESLKRPLVIGHVRPDADCLGAMFAVAAGFKTADRQMRVSLPDGSLSRRLDFLADWAKPPLALADDFAAADGFRRPRSRTHVGEVDLPPSPKRVAGLAARLGTDPLRPFGQQGPAEGIRPGERAGRSGGARGQGIREGRQGTAVRHRLQQGPFLQKHAALEERGVSESTLRFFDPAQELAPMPGRLLQLHSGN